MTCGERASFFPISLSLTSLQGTDIQCKIQLDQLSTTSLTACKFKNYFKLILICWEMKEELFLFPSPISCYKTLTLYVTFNCY